MRKCSLIDLREEFLSQIKYLGGRNYITFLRNISLFKLFKGWVCLILKYIIHTRFN